MVLVPGKPFCVSYGALGRFSNVAGLCSKLFQDGEPFSCMSNARPYARDANTKANQGKIISPQELKLTSFPMKNSDTTWL